MKGTLLTLLKYCTLQATIQASQQRPHLPFAKLKKKYFKGFDRVLPSKTVATFFQLENQIDLIIDLQIAARGQTRGG